MLLINKRDNKAFIAPFDVIGVIALIFLLLAWMFLSAVDIHNRTCCKSPMTKTLCA